MEAASRSVADGRAGATAAARAKNSKQRLRDIGDACIALDEVLAGTPDPATNESARAETLGFLGRVIHSLSPQALPKKLKLGVGDTADYVDASGCGVKCGAALHYKTASFPGSVLRLAATPGLLAE